MNATVNLNEEKDFKKMVEFLAELHYGHKSQIQSVLEHTFGTHYKDEYSFMEMTHIVDLNYDEDSGEPNTTWRDFKDLSEQSREYFLGNYYINFSEGWDRGGDITSRLFIKVDPSETGTEFVSRYHTLMNKRQPLAIAIDNLRLAIDSKSESLFNKAVVTPTEWAEFKAVNEELEEMGM